MTQIIGGHNLGLFDGSFTMLKRNDQTGLGTIGHGEQSFANVSNGDLIFQEHDVYLPSRGDDFDFVRTYNSRGTTDSRAWSFSMNVYLAKHNDTLPSGTAVTNYTVTYGDGSQLEFVSKGNNLWVSTDGGGNYETLQVVTGAKAADTTYVVTRADRSKYLFDSAFHLLSITDSNGVATTFEYNGDNVVKINIDNGSTTGGKHTLTLVYANNNLLTISDDASGQNKVLVQYVWSGEQLTQVIDRSGHVTKYHYNGDKLLDGITLPDTVVNGVTTTRTTSITYTKAKWDDHPHHVTDFDSGDAWVVSQITDANGGVTSFEYTFLFNDKGVMAPEDRDQAFKVNAGRDYLGGTTRVVDALGNARAYSNAAEFVKWRTDHGYYATYDPNAKGAALTTQTTQAEQIRAAQATTYTYDANGQITKVKDEFGFETSYTYDSSGNLTSTVSADGWGAVNSDSDYYRKLRGSLNIAGITDTTPASSLTADQKAAILAKFTSTNTYDSNGNLLTSTDNAGNTTTYTYTATNQVASIKTARGNTTTFTYDAHDNLITRIDSLGNKVAFEYDAGGNLTRKIVYLDKTDLNDLSKQQITTYGYDVNGNNTSVTTRLDSDPTHNIVTTRTFDHFGNVIVSVDGRGGQTTYAYDLDNRLLSTTDPEGHTTSYAYDTVGNQISVTDAGGHTITRVYDRNNMLISTSDPSSDATKTRNTAFVYDVLGDRTQVTDGEGRTMIYVYDAHRKLVEVVSPTVKASNGVTDTNYHQYFAYDGEGNTITSTDRNGNTTQYLFNVNGQLKRMTDAVGNVTEYTYNADLQMATMTVGMQLADETKRRLMTFTYDSEDQLETETDGIASAAGKKVRTYTYDAAGNIKSVANGEGKTSDFVYDLANRLITEIRPGSDPVTHNRYTITHQYDENGNEVLTTDEDGHTTKVSYDADNRAVLVEDGNGVKTVYAYDSRDNRTSISIGVKAHFDSSTKHVVIDDATGAHGTTYAYDEFNQLISKTDGIGNTEYYGYDRRGNQISVKDRLGNITATQYDAMNRAIAVTEAVGTASQRVTTLRYDGNDNLVKTIVNGRETSIAYDAMNRVIQQTDASGTVTRYVLDDFGNVVTRSDAYGLAVQRTTSFEYDTRGRITKQTDAAGTVTTFAYNLNDQLVTRTTGYGMQGVTARVETFEYNADGRLSAQVNGAGNRTEFTYDGVGNRIRIDILTGVAGSAVLRSNSFEYDGDNRVSAEIDGNLVRTEYRYDASGNKIEIIQAAGGADERHTLMFYDANDRLTSVVDPIGWARANSNATEFSTWRTTHSPAYEADAKNLSDAARNQIYDTQRTTYGYDAVGDQTTITEADGTVTKNTFDELGRLVTNIVGFGSTHNGVKTTNTYDVFGNVLTSTRAWNDDGTDARTTTYTYDALDHQTSVTDGEGFQTVFTYDVFGNQTQIQRGGYTGSDSAKQAAKHTYTTTLTYDAMNRLLTTVDGRGNQVRNTYDAFGNRATQVTGETINNTDLAHASTLTFTYDGAGRMTRRENTATGGLVKITYDAAGNQTMVKTLQSGTDGDAGAKWTTQTFEYDGNGRTIKSYDSYSTRTDYIYDAVGNLTSIVSDAGNSDATLKHTTAYEYDLDDNRTALIDAMNNRTSFAYDAVGNMIKSTDALGHVTRFYYDAFGRPSAQLSARNFLTTFTRDSAGNITQTHVYMDAVADPGDSRTPPTPQSAGANDRITTSVFDRANRLTQQTAPDGSYKTYAYDSTNKLLTQKQYGTPGNTRTADATARTMTWEYDDSGRLSRFTNVDGTIEEYAYDAANNKISQTIKPKANTTLANGQTDPERKTTFTYDLDNRLLTQTFDPNGTGSGHLDIVQSLVYDKAGNVTSKTDADSHVTYTIYDLENRVKRVTPSLDANNTNYIEFTYDAFGNKTQVRDNRGNVTEFTYDKDNRVTQEKQPARTVYKWTQNANGTWSQSSESKNPIITTSYDALGNVRQITDARGFVTTYWYDATNNKIAERNGDDAVRRFTYDGLGEVLTITLDMTPHTGETIGDVNTPPTVITTLSGGGSAPPPRVITNTYDLGGRVTRTEYSSITVTTLGNTSGGAPTSSASTVTPYELNYYDGFGNKVEAVDRDGVHTYAWYDVKNRQVATLDGSRYLVETDYDDQDHVVQQRKYKTQVAAFSPASMTDQRAAHKPDHPDSSPATLDRIYDAAGREIEEISPAVHAKVGTTIDNYRVVTHFTYDAAGNMTSKALNYATIDSTGHRTETATASQRIEYSWYDQFNRRVAVVGPDRVLNTFTYDENGNIIAQRRYFNAVGSGHTLSASTTLSDVTGWVTADNDHDEETRFVYDSANKLITQTDEMDLDTDTDNLSVQSGYDESGNLSYRVDADNDASKNRYNAAGLILETVTPNGGDSFILYDTSGLKVKAWTGSASGSTAPEATNIGANVGNGTTQPLTITWDQTIANVTSWVAWDTSASGHASTGLPSSAPGVGGTYANATSAQGVGTGLSAQISVAGNTTVFFRIMTRDAGGNITWTEEKSVYVPPRISAMQISGPSSGNYTLTVTFDAAVTSPVLKKGSTSISPSTTNGNTYSFTFTGSTTDDFHMEWTKTVNNTDVTYMTSNVKLLAGPGPHIDAGNGWVQWQLPADAAMVGNGQFIFVNGQLVQDKSYIGASTTAYMTRTNNTQVNFQAFTTPVPHNSTINYDVVYGNISTETHDAGIGYSQRQTATYTLDHQDKDSNNNVTHSYWNATYADGQMLVDLSVTLTSAENGRIKSGTNGIHFSIRDTSTSGIGGFDTDTSDTSGDTQSDGRIKYNGSLNVSKNHSYEIKIWYTDSSTGKEVILEYRHITAPNVDADLSTNTSTRPAQVETDGTASPPTYANIQSIGSTTSFTGDRSLQEKGASETGGQIASDSSGKLTVTVGTYVGPLNPGTSTLTLTPAATTHLGDGHLSGDGLLTQTYFTEIEYNALGVTIGTNEDTGLWRRIGVDANGNAVEVDVYGTRAAETAYNGGSGDLMMKPNTTFKTYDERNLETGSWGGTLVGSGVNAVRGVTRTTYDYAQHMVAVIDPGNTSTNQRTFAYDDVGNLTSKTDAEGNTTTSVYNVFGQWLTVTDPKRTRTRTYDSAGLLTDESINNVTDHAFYTYDAFGRRTSVSRGTTGSGNATVVNMTYDQRDRLTTVSDGMATPDVIHYYYDGRNNLIWTMDAMGRWFGSAYDGMGQLIHTYSFATRWTSATGGVTTGLTAPDKNTSLADVEGATNSSSTYHAALVDEATTYDLFGNKTSTTDAAGHHQFYSYGAFGRLTSVSGDSIPITALIVNGWLDLNLSITALTTNYGYDRFGNKTSETSNYGKNIAYTYDADQHVTSIDDTGLATADPSKRTTTTLTYDVAGRLTGEELQKAIGVNNALVDIHNITYTYNHNGWMTSWSDAAPVLGTGKTGIGESFTYDGVGNITSVTGKISGNSAYFVHNYTYDNANRVLTIANGTTVTDTYHYDNHGRRDSWVHGTETVAYTYDAADRVIQAAKTDSSVSDHSKDSTLYWTYDKDGNVTSVKDSTSLTITTDSNGNVTADANGNYVSGRDTGRHYTIYLYDANNVSWFSESSNSTDKHADGYNQTTDNMDKSGREITTVVHDGGADKTYTYTHYYNADGTEARVGASGSGDVSGNQISTYDVDRQLIHLDLGKGDEMDRNETKDFDYDNAGHIISATHDPGKGDVNTVVTHTNYLYANGNPAGEYSAINTPTLDTGNYSVLQNVPGVYGDSSPPDFPTTAVADHIVEQGETLQSIAGQVYGHPELWFVIADANGLTGAEQLTPGMRLIIPNSVQYGGFNTETHTIYQEGDIVGSKLPNLKTPPPHHNKCAVIAAIILIVVVAIIAIALTVVTVGAAAPAAAAAIGGTAGVAAGIIAGAVIGAAIAFTASVITQGILIGFQLQQGFDWKAVAADTAAGAFSGAAVGLGAIVRTVEVATTLIRIADVVGQTALQVAGEVTRQVIVSGHVDDWTGVALAGVGGALGAYGAQAERDRKVASKVVELEAKFAKLADEGAKLEKPIEEASRLKKIVTSIRGVVNYVKSLLPETKAVDSAAGKAANEVADLSTEARGGKFLANLLTSTVDVLGGNTGRIAKLEEATNSLRASLTVVARETAQFTGKAVEDAGEIEARAIALEAGVKLALYSSIALNVTRQFYVPGFRPTRTSASTFGAGGSTGVLTGIGNLVAGTARSVLNTLAAADADDARRRAANSNRLPPQVNPARSDTFNDPNASTDFIDLHNRRHGWVITDWVDAAASSASQIVSSFAVDQNADLGTVLAFNRLLAGETSHFSFSDISNLAAGTVGKVGMNPIPLPIMLLNSSAPSAYGR